MATTFPPAPPPLSATGRSVLGRRREPGRAWAAVFAFIVHAGFFALIVFGVSWQVKVPAPLSAEIWESLPPRPTQKVAETAPEPKPEPTPPAPVQKLAEPPKPVEPAKPTKADIALKAKLEREQKREREEKLAAEAKKRDEQKRVEEKRAEDKRKADDEKLRKAEQAKQKAAEEQARSEAEAKEAAIKGARDKALSDYTGKIAALIRSRANIPDSVIGQPEIVVKVRLLTNGTVFEASVSKPSGNRVYDEAVERAINGIRQWPVPESPEILGRQRELNLNIKHER